MNNTYKLKLVDRKIKYPDLIISSLIYQQLNCSGCHSGPSFTDSPQGLRHDVGTIKITSGQRLGSNTLNGIDTPTLKALWHSAPYFHDGAATTIDQAIEDTGWHQLGIRLTLSEIRAIKTFFNTLNNELNIE